jgi:hypothetical protein
MRAPGLVMASLFGGALVAAAPPVPPSLTTHFVSTPCDAVLRQNIDVAHSSEQLQAAYFMLVDQSNYEQAKHDAGASVIGIFGANYSDFETNRQQFQMQKHLQITHDVAVSILRASVSAAQVDAWQKCITQTAVGIRVLLKDETADGASGEIFYTGTPGQTVRATVSVVGGNIGGQHAVQKWNIASGGTQAFVLSRAPNAALRVTVNTNNNLSDIAFSPFPTASPGPVVPPPDPPEVLLSQGKPTKASVGNAAVAVDGNANTGWNAGAMVPQWIEIDLGQSRTITHVQLNPCQTPPGLTHHTVYGILAADPSQRVVLADFDFPTVDRGILFSNVSRVVGKGIKGIRVETTQSPSWVCWWEVQVYGF